MTSLTVHNFTQDELLIQLPVLEKAQDAKAELSSVSPSSVVELMVHKRPLFMRWKRHVIVSKGAEPKGYIIFLDKKCGKSYVYAVKDDELPWTVYWVHVRFRDRCW